MELLKEELKILALRERYFGNFDKFENYKEEIKLEKKTKKNKNG